MPDPNPEPDSSDEWQVVASRPDYSERAPCGRFATADEAEELAEKLRAEGYRDVQVERIYSDDRA